MTTNKKIAAVAGIVGGVIAAATSASAALNLPTQSCSYNFTTNMRVGTRNSQVMDLQKVLNMYPQTTVALSGPGSMGNETNFYGAATARAVSKFQELHAADTLAPIGATKGTGNAFTLTRAVLNQICNGGSVVVNPGTGTVVNGSVTASLTAGQPNQVIVATQAAAELAKFTFTGNGNVTQVKLARTGISNNSTLTNVYLYDGATRLTDSASVLADGSVTFNNASGVFSVNGSRTVTVRADVAPTTSGQSVGVTLTGYTTSGAAASVVNLMGNNQPIASVTLASVSLSGSNVSAATINAGQMNTNVWSQTMNVGTRAVKLHSIAFKMIGSAPADALTNVSLFIDGTKVGNSSAFDNTGRVTFDMTSSPMLLNTGNRTIDLRADIVKGSNRNFQVSIENAADIRVEDRDVPNGFVTVTGSTNNTAGLITVAQGNLTIAQDPSFTATQVVGGASNVDIARYVVRAFGEDVKITSLEVLPSFPVTPTQAGNATPTAAGLNNVSLYVNGGQVGTSQNWTTVGNKVTFNNLGSSLYVPANGSVIVTVKADMVTSANVNYTAGAVRADLIAGTNNAQGVNSNQLTSTSAINGKQLTVVSGQATFGTTAGFSAQTINQNTTNVKIGSFTMQASNADALRVTNLAVALSGSIPLTSITNLTVKDGSTVLGTPIGNVSASNNFSVNINLPMSGTKTFEVFADINNANNGSTTTAAMTATYNGVTNTSALTSTHAGVAMTVQTAVLAAGSPVVNSVPVSQFVTPGTREVATFNIKSTNGNSTISKITFNLTGVTGINSITVGGVTKGIVTGASSVTVDGLSIAVPFSNSGVAIPVSASFNAVGLNQTNSGLTNVISISDVEYVSGNTTANTGVIASATSNTFTLVASMPTAVKGAGVSDTISGAATLRKVGTYSVTANASGDINLKTVAINIGMPVGATISAVELKEGNTAIAGSCTAAANTVCTFTTSNRVAAGTTKTFDVYATHAAATTNGTASVNAGPATSFTWDDTNAASGSLTGALVQNYGN
jgi:hypothetical protein